jgi:superfamily I DNA/RNA helicase
MIGLNSAQQEVVDLDVNVVVSACPGSGKTRVLTSRVQRALADVTSRKRRIVAMTYTNRAADEIKNRLDRLDIEQSQLWAGTIHSFAIEWILKPYAPYASRLQTGFEVADEFFTERLRRDLRQAHGASTSEVIHTRRARDGSRGNDTTLAKAIIADYDAKLTSLRLIDYDDVLYLAYKLVSDNVEIAATLASLIELFCVDEIQDTQDLQYGIVSCIVRSGEGRTKVFCVGDANQAIYDSLGAVSKTPTEIAEEFGLERIEQRPLSGNYRSTQRILNLCQAIRPAGPAIKALSPIAGEAGRITFLNQNCTRGEVPLVVANYVRESLNAGIPEREICIVAPQWNHVRSIARDLVKLLPTVSFDAPGLSPLYAQRESIWFKIGRLFLTSPSAPLFGTRMRWAWDVINDLRDTYEVNLTGSLATARGLLRSVNSIYSAETDGLEYLRKVFQRLEAILGVYEDTHSTLFVAQRIFFDKAEDRIASDGSAFDVTDLRKLFKHPSGVTVQTCSGIKGEEFETVIAFGLLRGYVPHWRDIFESAGRHADDRESKLLYVVCSRAKMRLHLIAESGRKTAKGFPLGTARLLEGIEFQFDDE